MKENNNNKKISYTEIILKFLLYIISYLSCIFFVFMYLLSQAIPSNNIF